MRTVLLTLLIAAPLAARPDGDMKHLTYAEIGKLARSHKGGPLVVYFWAST